VFIKEINLLAFRNYVEANLKLDRQKTIIIGRNAQGKSNLIEVIQLLSQFKSRRAKKDSELIHFELNESVIKVKIKSSIDKEENNDIYNSSFWNEEKSDQEELDELAVLIRPSGRRTYKLNGVNKKPKELLHKVLSVSFMSEDLNIINSSPSTRRDYLDSVIKQLSDIYADELGKFEKTLSQRNSYLKSLVDKGKYYPNSINPSEKAQLEVWNDIFVEQANTITRLRKKFTDNLEPKTSEFYQRISGDSKNQVSFEYLGEHINTQSLDESLAKDLARGYTNLGPHRDDFEINLNGSSAASFASQGEKRSIMLAVKLSELELLKEEHSDYPILLLDDVLAELDEDRQDFLLDAVSSKAQVIITTTHLGKHLEKWSEDSQIVEIKAGVITNSNTKDLAHN
jgi:DNA replication and repair protein RecF